MKFERADSNAAELDAVARGVGAVVEVLPREVGCDRIIAFRGTLYLVEYKDGSKPPSRRRLTANEARLAERLERVGCTVDVVTCTTDLLKVLGLQ